MTRIESIIMFLAIVVLVVSIQVSNQKSDVATLEILVDHVEILADNQRLAMENRELIRQLIELQYDQYNTLGGFDGWE